MPEIETRTWYDSSLIEVAQRTLGVPPDVAGRLAIEAAAHEAMGFDYLVSPGLMSTGPNRHRAWPRTFGACTVAEAFRLAGVKARMYRTAPISSMPRGLVSVNTGMWLDLAVMAFTPGLRRALRAALSPTGTRAEAATAGHLLAIRARLGELLASRDATYRLVRREALGPHWVRPFDAGPVSGAGGNDLTAQLAYHRTVALNSAFSASDNLAWVYAKRDQVPPTTRSVGFTDLVLQDKSGRRPWRSGPIAGAGAAALIASPALPLFLACRQVRNLLVHSDGVGTGAIEWEPPHDAPALGLSGWWVVSGQLDHMTLGDGRVVSLFEALASAADYSDADVAVFTFVRFVDRLWYETARLVSTGLLAIDWPSETSWKPHRSDIQRHWNQRQQRGLWGL